MPEECSRDLLARYQADIVQSAYRSFFRAARAGQYEVSEGRKLWSLSVWKAWATHERGR